MHTDNASSGKSRKRVGILFVHGVGEQTRFEHLTGSVLQFSELMRQSDKNAAVSIIDRTKDWKYPPGQPDKSSDAPISLSVTSQHRNVDFECHEVWWADLGARSGIGDVILFWIWGLGQWCAPIYRELDASGLRKDDRVHFNKPVPRIAKMPACVAGDPILEPITRLELVLVAIAAIAIGCTWGLAKRLLKSLLDQAPSPTILVQYLGDVRTYEERAAPGDSALSDPGFPRRVGIRRRMITEMVAMADRSFDEWYIAAHSLGTVVAYNGITEIGHTLPNYLPEQQWRALSDRYKTDTGCMLREDIYAMMPSRPGWLGKTDVINRPLLFRNLKGFLTYGSPLNKFVALWPRVVATATDRVEGDPHKPFSDHCRWINLASPSDPVAGRLRGFANGKGDLFEKAVPSVENISTPWTFKYGLAHILYFTGFERFVFNSASVQKRQTMKWLMGRRSGKLFDSKISICGKVLALYVAYIAIVALLLGAAAVALTMAGGLTAALFDPSKLMHFASFGAFLAASRSVFSPMVAAFLWTILLSGQWRWLRESSLNTKLAQGDSPKYSAGAKDPWPRLIAMLKAQRVASSLTMAGTLLGAFVLAVSQWPRDIAAALVALAVFGLLFSIMLQMSINSRVERLKKKTRVMPQSPAGTGR